MTQTVLVVDDSSFITEGLASLLKRDYRTIIASGGEMCLEILKKESPDIIILDILMEPMDGWETLLHIRENPVTRFIPVIMFSAKKISPFEAETQHPHIDDYITKPVSPRNLLETIAKVLSRKETSRKNLELWKTAGLETEEIEEYSRLTATIEVDYGLVANLQQQLSMERLNTPMGEIERTIELIHSRIRENSILAEEIAQRGNSLASPGSERDALPWIGNRVVSHAEPLLKERPPLPGIPQRDTGSSHQEVIPDERQDPSTERENQENTESTSVKTEETVPVPVTGQQGTDRQDRKETVSTVHSLDTTTHQDAERDFPMSTINVPAPESTSITVQETSKSGSTDTPQLNETTMSDNPPVMPVAEHLFEEEQDPGPVNTPSESILPAQFPTIPQENPGSEHHTMKDAPTPTPQKVVPTSPIAREEKDHHSIRAEQKTDTANTVRKSQKPVPPKRLEREKDVTHDTVSSSPGFFSRIISAIMNLFSRPKP